MIYRDFGNLVREYREKREFTQQQLADECGLSRAGIMHIELANQRVYLDQALRIAMVLEMPLDAIQLSLEKQIFRNQLEGQPAHLRQIISNSMDGEYE